LTFHRYVNRSIKVPTFLQNSCISKLKITNAYQLKWPWL